MKLVRINHIRCGEASYNYTYAWVDDQLDARDVKAAADRARDAYLAFLTEWKAAAPPNSEGAYMQPQYQRHPEMTVEAVDELHAKLRKEYREWQETQLAAKRSFSEYLKDEGITPVQTLDPGITIGVNWGHNHGVPIEYDTTTDNDIKGPGWSEDGRLVV